MLNPPLNQLTSQIKSKYLIATTAALEEIADGKIRPVISSDYYGKE